ncbi:MAG TPA: hypothetical protein VMC09_11975 [Anaerolineales bacterium]|nr:hypothetical protein [Anaerolineales bacterium]
MKPRNKFLMTLGSVLFYAGVILGMLLFAGLSWAGLESSFYFGYNGGAQTTLHLTCPRILTTHETGNVVATITNRTKSTVSPLYETQISGLLIRNLRTQQPIAPGQTVRLSWEVSGADVDYGSLVMAEVYQNPAYQIPTGMATCGTLYLNWPGLSGEGIFLAALAGSLLGLVAGFLLWFLSARPLVERSIEQFRGMTFVGVVVLFGLAFASFGHWGLGIFALVLCLLTLLVLLGRRLANS